MTQTYFSKGGYWLIETILEIDTELPAFIAPKVRIERASDAQISTLKQHFRTNSMFEYPVEYGRENKYVVTERTATSTRSEPVPLPREHWRYFLLTYEGNGLEVFVAKRLCLIADPPFHTRIIVHTSEPFGMGEEIGWGGDSFAQRTMINVCSEPVPRITHDTINDLKLAYEQLASVSKSHPEVDRAITMLHDLRMVPPQSSLYMLGLFAILELLLTRNPQDKENADSLSHQLSTKIPLIDRRLSRRIEYSKFTESGSEARFWKKLYAYRSAIAHGQKLNFDKDFRFLKSSEHAQMFVEEVCRKLLRHALTEPDLYQDLKAV